MISHEQLGTSKFQQLRCICQLISLGLISLGGNKRLKIYGKLNCCSGKRMKVENRVFFKNGQEAIQCGYRPCGHCMRGEFAKWKNQDKDRQM